MLKNSTYTLSVGGCDGGHVARELIGALRVAVDGVGDAVSIASEFGKHPAGQEKM